jgi:hypothetical protein
MHKSSADSIVGAFEIQEGADAALGLRNAGTVNTCENGDETTTQTEVGV